jgi:G:T-mismatch repair DNA endonuclease (very short patch repair protein)
MYSLLARLGVDPHELEVNYEHASGDDNFIALAIPTTKVGFALEGDVYDKFEKDGWYIVRFTIGELETFSRIYEAINVSGFEHVRRETQASMTKQGSKEEEMLLKAILSANLPKPNRNLRMVRDDGSELTTPDFAWEDVKVAFFMDGLWWHIGKDDKEKMRLLNEGALDPAKTEVIMNTSRHKATKDADIRSELSARGWTVLSCTDEDLADKEGVEKQVDRIARTLRQKKTELKARAGNLAPDSGAALPDINIRDLI